MKRLHPATIWLLGWIILTVLSFTVASLLSCSTPKNYTKCNTPLVIGAPQTTKSRALNRFD